MTREVISLLAKIEGGLTVAKSDAQTLIVGSDHTGYFADIARWNLTNIQEVMVHFRQLIDELEGRYRSIEDCPFEAERLPF